MSRWQLTVLVLGAAALFFTAQPAQAQPWVGSPAPAVVNPAPLMVSPGWGARPYRVLGRYNRFTRMTGYGTAWAPPTSGPVWVGRRWWALRHQQ
jgi:hypothetical protein